MRHALLLLTALAMVGLISCDWEDMSPRTREKEDFHYSYDLKPGGRLTVESFNGSVEIYGWDKDKVEINGTKYASTRDLLNEIKIEVTPSADLIQIRTLVPSMEGRRGNRGARYVIHLPIRTRLERIESSNGPLRVESIDGEGRLKTSNGPVRLVKFRGNVDVRTSNGPITLDEFSGEALLATSNGPIKASGVRGYLDASTSNGPLTATVDDPDSARPLKLRTSNGPLTLTLPSGRLADVSAVTNNGPITLRLPASANARLKARTSNSNVTCDFGLNQVTLQSKTEVEGVIGQGGPILDLRTSNGGIRVVRN